MATKRLKFYFGAALFSGRETCFNMALATRLEKRGQEVILPQRDGFEFSKLALSLAKRMDEKEAAAACERIIYVLDIGKFVYESDVILANLDEPIDEGLMVEVMMGRMMGKNVVGYRTDVRSPYGTLNPPFRGMHFFPAFQCNRFIYASIQAASAASAEEELDRLAKRILSAGRDWKSSGANVTHPVIAMTVDVADRLFQGIENLHSETGLNEIVNRYVRMKESFESISPMIWE